MGSTKAPNRHRWDGWVVFAWLLVAIALVGGIVLISTMGMMEVPERDFLGNIKMVERPNPIVWSAAIGQFVASLLLAAIFSILNSIYQNSCDMLSSREGAGVNSARGDSSEQNVESPDEGVSIIHIGEQSPLYQILVPGDKVVSVNGEQVNGVQEFNKGLIEGANEIEYVNDKGMLVTRRVKLRDGPKNLAVKGKGPLDANQEDKRTYIDMGEEVEDTESYSAPVLRVDAVSKSSPLYGHVEPGYALMAVNGQEVSSEQDAISKMTDGLNEFTFRNKSWKLIKRFVEMKPGSLDITFY